MPPLTALIVCSVFIFYLYVNDLRRKPKVSRAIWIPLIWLLILGSRAVSQWLNLGVSFESPDEFLEGSPLDRAIFGVLIGIGLFILLRRRLNWSQIFRTNGWVFLFFVYCGISVMWSDYSFVAGKRWVKGIGDLVMVLVILTELNPIEAVKVVLRRWAYVLIPLSVVLIKYFPELGRAYDGSTRWHSTRGSEPIRICLAIYAFFVASFLYGIHSQCCARKADILGKRNCALMCCFWE